MFGRMGGADGSHIFRRQLSIRRRNGENHMSCGLKSAGLMHQRVAGTGGDDCFHRPQEGGAGYKVYLGTAHQEVNVCLRCAAQIA